MTQPTDSGGATRNLNFLFIVGLILAIFLIIFAIQNADRTEVEFFNFRTEPHLALLIISCIALGAVITLLFSIPGWWRRRKARKTLEQELGNLRKKYEELASVQPGPIPSGSNKA